jgi:methylated-DNA-[protein]-cysteine S-methyltransferase
MPVMFCKMPLGIFRVEEENGALTRIEYCGATGTPSASVPALAVREPTPLLREAHAQLSAFFEGRLRGLDLPLALRGTEFQLRVWEELRRIVWGEVRTYGEVACALGMPRAARAVGMACKSNPLLIAVPCHRVIGAGGRLAGFACGLDMKRFLLALEGVSLVGPRGER